MPLPTLLLGVNTHSFESVVKASSYPQAPEVAGFEETIRRLMEG